MQESVNDKEIIEVNREDTAQTIEDLRYAYDLSDYEAYVLQHMYEIRFMRVHQKTTVCCLKFMNGFEVTDISACANPEEFDEDLGRRYALKDAIRKAGEFICFMESQERMYARMMQAEQATIVPSEEDESRL